MCPSTGTLSPSDRSVTSSVSGGVEWSSLLNVLCFATFAVGTLSYRMFAVAIGRQKLQVQWTLRLGFAPPRDLKTPLDKNMSWRFGWRTSEHICLATKLKFSVAAAWWFSGQCTILCVPDTPLMFCRRSLRGGGLQATRSVPGSESFSLPCPGDLARAIRNRTGIHFGLYHSLFEWFNPLFLQDQANKFQSNKFVMVSVSDHRTSFAWCVGFNFENWIELFIGTARVSRDGCSFPGAHWMGACALLVRKHPFWLCFPWVLISGHSQGEHLCSTHERAMLVSARDPVRSIARWEQSVTVVLWTCEYFAALPGVWGQNTHDSLSRSDHPQQMLSFCAWSSNF